LTFKTGPGKQKEQMVDEQKTSRYKNYLRTRRLEGRINLFDYVKGGQGRRSQRQDWGKRQEGGSFRRRKPLPTKKHRQRARDPKKNKNHHHLVPHVEKKKNGSARPKSHANRKGVGELDIGSKGLLTGRGRSGTAKENAVRKSAG